MDRKIPDMETLSLKAARVNAELSRSEVERETGITAGMLARYESGKSEPPATAIQKLCLLYGIGIERLRFGKKAKGDDK